MDRSKQTIVIPSVSPKRLRGPSVFVMIGVVLLLVSSVLVATANISIHASLGQLKESGSHLLELYQKVLRSELQRHAYLPLTLSRNRDVVKLLELPAQPGLQDDLNRYLEQISEGTDALAVYVLDRNGTTLASSNWRASTSYVGHNYSFRPYFQTALLGQSSHYFAVGATTKIPGLFISYPVKVSGHVLGVVAIKVSMAPLEEAWAENGREIVTLSDQHGVIFSSSELRLQFYTLRPLDTLTRRQMEDSRKYANQTLKPLMIKPAAFWGIGAEELVSLQQVTLPSPASDSIQGRYLLQQHPLKGTRWVLSVLSDLKPVNSSLAYSLMIAFAVLMMAAMAVVFVIQARSNRVEKEHLEHLAQKALIRANDDLEHRVELRTQELKETQHELIQTSKLAALGKMSAGIAHELNQPLAALRTFSSSGILLIQRQQYEKAGQNFERVNTLAERIGLLTSQLKVLARQEPVMPSSVNIAEVVQHAMDVTENALYTHNIHFEFPSQELSIAVLADRVQLEQVLINLLSNAVHAVQLVSEPIITIEISRVAGQTVMCVRDNGCGITADILPQLFDPFFTTKEVGEGLGLGLSLVNGMVRGWGGYVQVKPLSQGTEFSVYMQSARTEESV